MKYIIGCIDQNSSILNQKYNIEANKIFNIVAICKDRFYLYGFYQTERRIITRKALVFNNIKYAKEFLNLMIEYRNHLFYNSKNTNLLEIIEWIE